MEQLTEIDQSKKRVRVDDIKHPKQRAFLEAFILTGNDRGAERKAKESGLSVCRASHYNWLKRPDGRYKAAFEDAKRLHLQHLEDELIKRALAGKEDPRSHICLLARLKKLDPGYRDGPAVQVNQGVQVNVNIEKERAEVKAMILKAQEIDGGEESKS